MATKRTRTGSPQWKLYNSDGDYMASAHDVALLACCIGLLGEGATIKFNHKFTVWTEGVDGFARESYDDVCIVAQERLAARTDLLGRVHGTATAKERANQHYKANGFVR